MTLYQVPPIFQELYQCRGTGKKVLSFPLRMSGEKHRQVKPIVRREIIHVLHIGNKARQKLNLNKHKSLYALMETN